MYCIKKTVSQSQLTAGSRNKDTGVRYMNQHLARPRRMWKTASALIRSRLHPTTRNTPAGVQIPTSNATEEFLRISVGRRCPRGVRGNRRREKGGRRGGEQAVIVFDRRPYRLPCDGPPTPANLKSGDDARSEDDDPLAPAKCSKRVQFRIDDINGGIPDAGLTS